MEEEKELKKLILKLGLENQWVRVQVPTTTQFLGKNLYNHYGTLTSINDEYIILFSKKYGLIRIPLKDIQHISKARRPEEEN